MTRSEANSSDICMMAPPIKYTLIRLTMDRYELAHIPSKTLTNATRGGPRWMKSTTCSSARRLLGGGRRATAVTVLVARRRPPRIYSGSIRARAGAGRRRRGCGLSRPRPGRVIYGGCHDVGWSATAPHDRRPLGGGR